MYAELPLPLAVVVPAPFLGLPSVACLPGLARAALCLPLVVGAGTGPGAAAALVAPVHADRALVPCASPLRAYAHLARDAVAAVLAAGAAAGWLPSAPDGSPPGASAVLAAAHDLVLDAPDACGRSPLTYAAATASEDMVRHLLACGADPDGRSDGLLATVLASAIDLPRLQVPGPAVALPQTPLSAALLSVLREGGQHLKLRADVIGAFEAELPDGEAAVGTYHTAVAEAEGLAAGSPHPEPEPGSAWDAANTLLAHRAGADASALWAGPVHSLLGDGWASHLAERETVPEDWLTEGRRAAALLRASPQLLALAACCAGQAAAGPALALSAAAAWQARLASPPDEPPPLPPLEASHAAILSAVVGAPWRVAFTHHGAAGETTAHGGMAGTPAHRPGLRCMVDLGASARRSADLATVFALRHSPVGRAAVAYAASWPERAEASGDPAYEPRSPLLLVLLSCGLLRAAEHVAAACGERSGMGCVRAWPAAAWPSRCLPGPSLSAVEEAAASGAAEVLLALLEPGPGPEECEGRARVDPAARWAPSLGLPRSSAGARGGRGRDGVTVLPPSGGSVHAAYLWADGRRPVPMLDAPADTGHDVGDSFDDELRAAQGAPTPGSWTAARQPAPSALWLAARHGRAGALEVLLRRAASLHAAHAHAGGGAMSPTPVTPGAVSGAGDDGERHPVLSGHAVADAEPLSGLTLVEAAVVSGSAGCLALVLRHSLPTAPAYAAAAAGGAAATLGGSGPPMLSVFGAAGVVRARLSLRHAPPADGEPRWADAASIAGPAASSTYDTPMAAALRCGNLRAAAMLATAGARVTSPLLAAVVEEIAAAAADVAAVPLARMDPFGPTHPGFGQPVAARPGPAGSPLRGGSGGADPGRSGVGAGAGHGTVWLHSATDAFLSAVRRDDPLLLGLVIDHVWQTALVSAPASSRRAALSPPEDWHVGGGGAGGTMAPEGDDSAAGGAGGGFTWAFAGAVGRRAMARALCRVRVFHGPPRQKAPLPSQGGWAPEEESPGEWADRTASGRGGAEGRWGWEGVLEVATAAAASRASAPLSSPGSFVPPFVCADDGALFAEDPRSRPRGGGASLGTPSSLWGTSGLQDVTRVSHASAYAAGQSAGRVGVSIAAAAAASRLREHGDDGAPLTLALAVGSMPSDVQRSVKAADAARRPSARQASRWDGPDRGALAGVAYALRSVPGSGLLALAQAFPELRTECHTARTAGAVARLAGAGLVGLAAALSDGALWPPGWDLGGGAGEGSGASARPGAVLCPRPPHPAPAAMAAMLALQAASVVARAAGRPEAGARGFGHRDDAAFVPGLPLGRGPPGGGGDPRGAMTGVMSRLMQSSSRLSVATPGGAGRASTRAGTAADDGKPAVENGRLGLHDSERCGTALLVAVRRALLGGRDGLPKASASVAASRVSETLSAAAVAGSLMADADEVSDTDAASLVEVSMGLRWTHWVSLYSEDDEEDAGRRGGPAIGASAALDRAVRRSAAGLLPDGSGEGHQDGRLTPVAGRTGAAGGGTRGPRIVIHAPGRRESPVPGAWRSAEDLVRPGDAAAASVLDVLPASLRPSLARSGRASAAVEDGGAGLYAAASVLDLGAASAVAAGEVRALADQCRLHRAVFEAVGPRVVVGARPRGQALQRAWMLALLAPTALSSGSGVVSEAAFVIDAHDLGGERLDATTGVVASAAVTLFAAGPDRAPAILAGSRSWHLLRTAVRSRSPELTRIVLACGQRYLDSPSASSAASSFSSVGAPPTLGAAPAAAATLVSHWARGQGMVMSSLAAAAMLATVEALADCPTTPAASTALAEFEAERAATIASLADVGRAPLQPGAVVAGADAESAAAGANRAAATEARARARGMAEAEASIGSAANAAVEALPASATPETRRREAAKAFVEAVDAAVALPILARIAGRRTAGSGSGVGAGAARGGGFSLTAAGGAAGLSAGRAVLARCCARLACAVARRSEAVIRTARSLLGGEEDPGAELEADALVAMTTASTIRVAVEAWATCLAQAAALRAASGTLVDGGAAGAGGVLAVLATEGLLPPPRSTFADALVADPTAATALAAMSSLASSELRDDEAEPWRPASVLPLMEAVVAAAGLAGGKPAFAISTWGAARWRTDSAGPGDDGSDAEALPNTPPFDVLALSVGGLRLVRSLLWPVGCVRYLPLKPAVSAGQVHDDGDGPPGGGDDGATGEAEDGDDGGVTLPPMPAEGEPCTSAVMAEPLLDALLGRVFKHRAELDRHLEGIRGVIRGEEGRRREREHLRFGKLVVASLSARQAATLADPWSPGTPLLPST